MDDFVNKFLIAGIPLVLLIPFLVEGLKKINVLTDKTAGIGAIIVAGLGVSAVALVDFRPTLEPVVRYALAFVLFAIMAGGTAIGGYSQYKVVKKGE